MRFQIKHEIKGRIRIHFIQNHMTCGQADTLQYYLEGLKNVQAVKVYERLGDAVVLFAGNRGNLLSSLQKFRYDQVEVPAAYRDNSGRKMNRLYWDKLVNQVVLHYGKKFLLPYPVSSALTVLYSLKYIWKGIRTLLKGKIEVPVLDAAAITVSVIRGDYQTASSIMFLLGAGEILEEWTHKKSVDDLARSLSLKIEKVWKILDGQEVLVPADEISENDLVRVHMGNVIPFDGEVTEGEALVNQASLTGESIPIERRPGVTVYAGTVVEEGELAICVKKTNGAGKFEKIVTMIEESEKLKSSLESRAEHLADKLVPYTLLGTGLVYLLTRNAAKALSVLMVDFSCALKLAMPIAVLSAIREAGKYDITVKGGKYLEAVAEADTIVFDKTGTLTKAAPTVAEVVSFNGEKPDELLRIAACLEEHFPHSMAKAVVDAAVGKNLVHEELHSKVEYIVAHGISSRIGEKRIIIGSYHFVFEDEKCQMTEEDRERFLNLPSEYSHLYMAVDQKLAAVICIEDPVREEAGAVITSLKRAGISKVVMMTGDSERTAKAIAEKVGVDEYYSEVLPEDKAEFIEKEKAQGRKVIMIGDGINDSPALSAADAGIAIRDGAEIAREIADITAGSDSLFEIVTLKAISNALMKRIHKNYKRIVGINSALILSGVCGLVLPTTSALLHNSSTLVISLQSMKNLL